MILYKDCPIRQLSFNEEYTPRAEKPGRVVISPKKCLKCEVLVPESFQNLETASLIKAHIPSTLARIGLHVSVDEKKFETLLGLQQILKELWVTITNWGSVPVCFAITWHITLSNLRVMDDDPVGVLPLHAGDEYLAVRHEALAQIRTRDGQVIPCISRDDPLHFESCFHTLPFTPRELAPGDFLVIGARERIEQIPENHIGIISSADPDELAHSSATLIYPGSGGCVALEFLVGKNHILGPGAHVANLNIYKSPNQLDEYNGKYKTQGSIKPHYLA